MAGNQIPGTAGNPIPGVSSGAVFGSGPMGGGAWSFAAPGAGGGSLGSIAAFLKMFSKGGGGAGLSESVDSTISFDSLALAGGMASGGDVSPGTVYPVGEHGMEYFAPRTAGRIIPAGQMGGGHTFNYTIDARGTDPVLVERRARAAILAAHNSAISNAVVSNQELGKRTPQGR